MSTVQQPPLGEGFGMGMPGGDYPHPDDQAGIQRRMAEDAFRQQQDSWRAMASLEQRDGDRQQEGQWRSLEYFGIETFTEGIERLTDELRSLASASRHRGAVTETIGGQTVPSGERDYQFALARVFGNSMVVKELAVDEVRDNDTGKLMGARDVVVDREVWNPGLVDLLGNEYGRQRLAQELYALRETWEAEADRPANDRKVVKATNLKSSLSRDREWLSGRTTSIFEYPIAYFKDQRKRRDAARRIEEGERELADLEAFVTEIDHDEASRALQCLDQAIAKVTASAPPKSDKRDNSTPAKVARYKLWKSATTARREKEEIERFNNTYSRREVRRVQELARTTAQALDARAIAPNLELLNEVHAELGRMARIRSTGWEIAATRTSHSNNNYEVGRYWGIYISRSSGFASPPELRFFEESYGRGRTSTTDEGRWGDMHQNTNLPLVEPERMTRLLEDIMADPDTL